MLKIVCAICICLATFPAFCESTANYQIATITDVKPHRAAGDSASDVVSYDVSVRVGDTVYLTLYTPNPPLGTNTVKYATGRGLLVLIGKNTLTYHDILGRSVEVPIISQKPAIDAKTK
jgi:hypothetical protein